MYKRRKNNERERGTREECVLSRGLEEERGGGYVWTMRG